MVRSALRSPSLNTRVASPTSTTTSSWKCARLSDGTIVAPRIVRKLPFLEMILPMTASRSIPGTLLPASTRSAMNSRWARFRSPTAIVGVPTPADSNASRPSLPADTSPFTSNSVSSVTLIVTVPKSPSRSRNGRIATVYVISATSTSVRGPRTRMVFSSTGLTSAIKKDSAMAAAEPAGTDGKSGIRTTSCEASRSKSSCMNAARPRATTSRSLFDRLTDTAASPSGSPSSATTTAGFASPFSSTKTSADE